MLIHLKYFSILSCFLFTTVIGQDPNVHHKKYKCYMCDYCPVVLNGTQVKTGCYACATGGANNDVKRGCLTDRVRLPPGFPTNNLERCFGDLCNNKKSINEIDKPVKCYVCRHCTTGNTFVENVCGACATRTEAGVTNKYCLNSCLEITVTDGSTCCTSDLCNGKTKLHIQKSSILFLIILTGLSGYFL
ncbi:unnamed protein product [Trichobilharzia szidati]|nr:unnamed protein product [Trichobilharzia szidati]CAH8834308.1 unnamed protein product [Trichobilharzia szidati]